MEQTLMEGRKRKSHFAPVGEVLEQYLNQSKLGGKINLQRLQQLWPKAVGEKIAGFTRIVELNDNTLKVKLDKADWLPALQSLKGDIITNLNQELGKELVKEITFETQEPIKRTTRKAKPSP
jgi:predicted nucleic acid-binding Zn ribbon protein